jgi:hypothetical protein
LKLCVFFPTFLRDLKSLIFTHGTARRKIMCLVLWLKEPGCDILPTLCDLMTSVGLYSGSISDINLQTVSVVSTSPTGSGIPDKRIRFLLPYCSRLSKSFVSCRLTFQDHTFSPWEAEFLNLSFVVCRLKWTLWQRLCNFFYIIFRDFKCLTYRRLDNII